MISAAKGTYQPQIYGTVMADAFASSRRSSGSYTVGVTISVPLLDGGQRRADTDRASAVRSRLDAEVQEGELRVEKEVRQAWIDILTAAENYHTAQSAVIAAQSAYDVTAVRVQNQKSILVELLDASANLSRAKSNLALAVYDHAVAVARLKQEAGSGQ